jgi:ribosome-associated heat shock protein Hsp15
MSGEMGQQAATGSSAALRIDKWLWQARFCKSRALASKLCAAGRVRLSGALVHKAHQAVRVGDVLTFPQGHQIRVVRIVALGIRRGPAAEARLLYADLAPVPAPRAAETDPASVGRRAPGAGRPTKGDRRALDRLRGDA